MRPESGPNARLPSYRQSQISLWILATGLVLALLMEVKVVVEGESGGKSMVNPQGLLSTRLPSQVSPDTPLARARLVTQLSDDVL
jgi:hypothetical protein